MKVPCVPLIPSLSAFVNIYLMLKLSIPTWIRFAIWMVLGVHSHFSIWFVNLHTRSLHTRRSAKYSHDFAGMSIYCGYGYWNSSERLKRLQPRGSTSPAFVGSFSPATPRNHEGRQYERLSNNEWSVVTVWKNFHESTIIGTASHSLNIVTFVMFL